MDGIGQGEIQEFIAGFEKAVVRHDVGEGLAPAVLPHESVVLAFISPHEFAGLGVTAWPCAATKVVRNLRGTAEQALGGEVMVFIVRLSVLPVWPIPEGSATLLTVFQRAFHAGLSASPGSISSLGCQIVRSQEPSLWMTVST